MIVTKMNYKLNVRSCAVTSGDGGSIILVGGHGNDTTQSLDTVLQYQGSGGGWTTLPSEMMIICSDASNYPSLLCYIRPADCPP